VTSVETEVLSPVSSANASAVVDIIENSMLAANATEVTFCIIFCIMRFPFCTAAFLQALWRSATLQHPCTHCFLLPYILYHMRFASLGNKPEKQISRKVKSNFSTTQTTKKKPNLHGTASLSHISFCAITTTRVEKLVKTNSQIYGILLFRSLRYQFWHLLYFRGGKM